MIVGYARVSTDGQTLDAQHASLAAAGAERIFAEKISGAITDRKALGKAIAALGDGDVLLVTRLDRATQREMPAVAPIFDGEKEAKLIFHTGYERAVGLRRDDPVLAAMGPESVFLSVRQIVLSLARSTMPSSTTLFSNNRNVQRAYPLGGLEQARAGLGLPTG